jgi:hypothetical protein
VRFLIDDLHVDVRDARSDQAELAGRRQCQVEDAPTDVRAAIIDSDHDRLVAVRHPQFGAERQTTMRRCRQPIVDARAGGRATTGGLTIVSGPHIMDTEEKMDTKNGKPIIDQMTDIAAEAAGNLAETRVRAAAEKAKQEVATRCEALTVPRRKMKTPRMEPRDWPPVGLSASGGDAHSRQQA